MLTISFIIPFYKDYGYLKDAIYSILQIHKYEVDIIIVNDNPCADTFNYLKPFEDIDNLEIIHHDENKGLSAARNTGIRACEGDAVAFVDADDFIFSDPFTSKVDLLFENDSDFIQSPAIIGYENSPSIIHTRDRFLFENKNLINTNIDTTNELQFIVSSWQSVYKKEFIKTTTFDEDQRKFEDRLYVLQCVFSAKKISRYPSATRFYRRRPNSITSTTKKSDDVLMMVDLIIKCNLLVQQSSKNDVLIEREKFLSLFRLMNQLPIFEFLHHNPSESQEILLRLKRIFDGYSLSDDIINDPIMSKFISFNGTKNLYGLEINRDFAERVVHQIKSAKLDESLEEYYLTPVNSKSELPNKVQFNKGSNVKIILHLGSHKTGTTAVQRYCEVNREALVEQGILFPETGYFSSSMNAFTATPGHQGILNAAVNEDDVFFEELYREIENSTCSSVFISCENMSLPFHNHGDKVTTVNKLGRYLGVYASVRLVYCFRHPIDYLNSFYWEKVRGQQFNKIILNEAQFSNVWLENSTSFDNVLSVFEYAFSTNAHLINYEDLKKGSLVESFVKTVLKVDFLGEIKNTQGIYKSLDETEKKFAALIGNLDMTIQHRRQFRDSFLAAYRAARRLDYDEAQELKLRRERVSESWSAINQDALEQRIPNFDFNDFLSNDVQRYPSGTAGGRVDDVKVALDIFNLMLVQRSILNKAPQIKEKRKSDPNRLKQLARFVFYRYWVVRKAWSLIAFARLIVKG